MMCEDCIHEKVCEGYSNCEEVGLCEPKRTHGEWIEQPNDHNHFMCSECGKPCDRVLTVSGYIVEQLSDFCPDCGADMRGEKKSGIAPEYP